MPDDERLTSRLEFCDYIVALNNMAAAVAKYVSSGEWPSDIEDIHRDLMAAIDDYNMVN